MSFPPYVIIVVVQIQIDVTVRSWIVYEYTVLSTNVCMRMYSSTDNGYVQYCVQYSTVLYCTVQ
jgi:hypothetical protein